MPAFAGTEASVDLEAAGLDDARPLLDFICVEAGELLWSADEGLGTHLTNALVGRRILLDGGDLGSEPGDDVRRHFRGRQHAVPGVAGELEESRFGDRGHG